MKCSKCGEKLEPKFNPYQDEDADYVEVEFACINNHEYFVRIKEDDLIESE